MRDQHPDFSFIPVSDVVLRLQLSGLVFLEGLQDPRSLVPVAVKNEHRLLARLNDFLERPDLFLVKLDHAAVIVINRATGQLQELSHDCRGIGRRHLSLIVKLQEMLLFELFVYLLLLVGERHRDDPINPIRELQIVLREHRHCDVFDLFRDSSVSAWDRDPVVDDVAVGSSRPEVFPTVRADRPPQSFASVEEIDLRPEIHEPVRIRCAGEAYDPPEHRPDPFQCSEAFRLRALEGAQLVDHQHVPLPRRPIVPHKPGHIFTVDHIDIGLRGDSFPPLLRGSEDLQDPEVLQVIPFFTLPAPRISGDHERRNNKDARHCQFVIDQALCRSERDHALAQAHLQKQTDRRKRHDLFDCSFLIIVWDELHSGITSFLIS